MRETKRKIRGKSWPLNAIVDRTRPMRKENELRTRSFLRQGFCFRDLRKGVLKTLFSKKDFTTDMFQFVADKGVDGLFAFFFGCENFWE